LPDHASLSEIQTHSAQRRSTRSYSRRFLTDEIVASFARDWRKHGDKSLERLRRTNLAVYVKLAVFLVPKEHKVEHTNTYEGLSTEQIEDYIAALQEKLDRKAGKLIDVTPNPPAPEPGDPGYKGGIYAHAATAVAPTRKRRK